MCVSLLVLRLEIAQDSKFVEIFSTSDSDMPKVRSANKPLKCEEIRRQQGNRTPANISVTTFDVPASIEDSSSSTHAEKPSSSDTEEISFCSGNPFVEKTQGILHLYKQNTVTTLHSDVERSSLLCMLGVPAALTSHDLLRFIAHASSDISQIKFIWDESPNQYMVLLKFRSQKGADEFYSIHNGQPYNSIEPDVCCLAFVAHVEALKDTEGGSLPLDGHTELPVCPVCLERMDESVEGILTILCNHSFHGHCLFQWGDTSHYIETSHAYCLLVGSQRVWDYTGDNYVHRLIQTKTDGKLVEHENPFHDPAALQQEEKMDAITLEYTYLLTSQLESQRLFFEEKMSKIESMASAQMEDLELQLKAVSIKCDQLQTDLKSCCSEKNSLSRKVEQSHERVDKLRAELDDEKHLNKCLVENQAGWTEKVNALQSELANVKSTKEREVNDLQEQLRDLMFHLESESKINAASNELRSDIQEGQVIVGPSSEQSGNAHRRNRKKKK